MELSKIDLKENTLVKFDLKNGISGTGLIKGIAIGGNPVIGKSYIIALIDSVGINKDTYPYSTLAVFELFIEVVNLNSNT